ncbi:MAG TPA: hypothetical protein VMU47_00900 [Caldimonas sp.]|nr:hypothetical protein [Caldimonas sp.]
MKIFDYFRIRQARKMAAQARRRAAEAAARPSATSRAPAPAAPEALTPAASAWLRALPMRVKPLQLCSAYPRVVNRIAAAWSDPALTDGVFNELLLDRRGGRKGFPPGIAAEILRLHAYHEQRWLAARVAAP